MSIRDYSVSVKSLAVAVAFAAATVSGAAAADMSVMPVKAPPKDLPFFLVNDNSVSFTWYPNATDPGVSGGGIAGNSNSFDKFVFSATHFDVWAYGTNFFNIDILKSSNANPVNNQFTPRATGAVEVYALGRSTFSGNAVSGSKMFSNVITKDISFEYGGDINTENDGLGPQKRDVVVGGMFSLNLPGTVNLGVLAYKEWNNNNFFVVGPFSGEREFQWIPRLELLISEPLTFLPLPVTWNSFTGVNFPKGTGISSAQLIAVCGVGGCTGPNPASAFSKTEVFEDNRLTLDAGKLAWNKSGIWDVYAGYRYWYNKFGTDHNAPIFATIAPGTSVESTAYVGTTYHFK
jgi:hypothetical protein